MAATDAVEDATPQEAHPAKALPAETVEGLAQALEDAQLAGEPVDALAEAVAYGDAIKTEVFGDEAAGQVLVITAEPECIEATVQPERAVQVKKPTGKDRDKNGMTATDSVGK